MESPPSAPLRNPSPAVALLFVACLVAAPRPAVAQSRSFGPLTHEEQAPLQRISYTHATERADLVGRGTLEAYFSVGYSNIFQEDSTSAYRLFLDLERVISAAGVRYGVSRTLEVGTRVSWETSGGGLLDGFIAGFHETLHLPNADREFYPRGRYSQRLEGDRGVALLDVPQRTLALADVRVSAKWRVGSSADGRRVVSLRGVVRKPIQKNVVGAQRADVSLMAVTRTSWDRWHLHGTLGGATVRAAADYDGLIRSSAWFGDVALERNLAPWISAIVQYSIATPRMRGFNDKALDGWPRNLLVGAAGTLGRAWAWDLSLQEDVPPSTPSVDFTLGIGLRRTW